MAIGRTSDCFPLQQGAVFRATVLDGCGEPFDGQCVSAISDGWSEIVLTANTEDSETTSATNARGRVLASKTTEPKFLNYTVNVTMAQVEPIIFAMLTGASMKIDPQTNKVVGFGIGTGTKLTGAGVGLEIWAESPGAANCDPDSPDAQGRYILQVLPFLEGGVLTGYTLNSDFVTFSIEGMTTRDGNGWGVGPYDDVYLSGPGQTLGALPAEFVNTNEHLIVVETQVAPPEASCDCSSSGASPTTATAGSPGSFDGDWIPETLADLGADYLDITASPSGAWTTGQHVVLGDGSHANWSGTAWAAGDHA